jgi:small subunit ribosomal protein S16
MIIAYIMVKIRLRRGGAKNRPSYRVVVADARSPQDGVYLEKIGHYDPLTDPETVVIEEEKALKWLRCGAQPTQAVTRLLSKFGVIEKFKAGKSTTAD